jgi:antitoxin (DNA-binding transcriptional repressor) of toxin-antitoxin stability system
MTNVSLTDADDNDPPGQNAPLPLSQRGRGGETLIVARGNKPVARIVPFSADERRFDGLTDVVVRIDESFSNPLDDFAPYMVAEDPS